MPTVISGGSSSLVFPLFIGKSNRFSCVNFGGKATSSVAEINRIRKIFLLLSISQNSDSDNANSAKKLYSEKSSQRFANNNDILYKSFLIKKHLTYFLRVRTIL